MVRAVARLAHTAGATVTADAPYRTTAEEICIHRANGVRAQEMEAAALFALGQVRGLPVASAVVIDAVPDQAGTAFRMDHQRAGGCCGSCSPRRSRSSPGKPGRPVRLSWV